MCRHRGLGGGGKHGAFILLLGTFVPGEKKSILLPQREREGEERRDGEEGEKKGGRRKLGKKKPECVCVCVCPRWTDGGRIFSSGPQSWR